ncbi:MAG: hypothetical protein H6742_17765 [Alphaproteobacteria bacterium]|nr:hypothetical protein [Alphaproteobacteria bacterium]
MRPSFAIPGVGLLLLGGCLERSTGDAVELDERFVAKGGPSITISGTLTAQDDAPIYIDYAIADPEAPGGLARLGKETVDAPGDFSVDVTAGVGKLLLTAFQDLESDGPDAADPFGHVVLTIGEADVSGVGIELVVGGFDEAKNALGATPGGGGAGGPDHVEVPHGAGGAPVATAEALARVPTPDKVLFADETGPTVTLRGTLSASGEVPVDVIVRLPDGRSDDTLLAPVGAFALSVPSAAGDVELVALQDMAVDGSTPGDPQLTVSLAVGELDIDGIVVELAGATAAEGAPGGGGDAPEHVEAVHEDAAEGAAGGERVVQSPGPFDSFDGATVMVRGEVVSDHTGSIDLDLRRPDASAEGGVEALGKVLLGSAGSFEIKVPAKLGELRLEGFQDAGHDGPDAKDPWGQARVDVGASDVDGVRLVLVPGARGTGEQHVEVPHTEASAGAAGTVDLDRIGTPVNPDGVGPFSTTAGPHVYLRGAVQAESDAPVDVDVWVQVEGQTELRNQGKFVLLTPGAFVLRVPKGAGKIAIEAYQDRDVDGPTEVDPIARQELVVGGSDIEGLLLALESTGAGAADPTAPGRAAGGPPAGPTGPPFQDYEGDMVKVVGTVAAAAPGRVSIDVRVPDADAPGGMRMEGKVQLDKPGAFEFSVPVDLGSVELEAFQDPDTNGPDDDDPYARKSLTIARTDQSVSLELVEGGRAQAAAAGAAPASANAAPAAGGGATPFSGVEGDRVTVSGTLTWEGDGRVDLDIFQVDAASPGGRKIAGKLRLEPGPWSVEVPVSVGSLEFEAFVDVDSDGPTATDPAGRYAGNPLTIGDSDIDGVDITIVAATAASAPAGG